MVTRKTVKASPGTPEEILAEAHATAHSTAAFVGELEQRIRSADETVTQSDLDEARSRAEWAQLQLDAAKVKAERLRVELAHKAYEEHVGALYELATGDQSEAIEEHLATARAALSDAFALIDDQNAAVYALSRYISEHADELPHEHVTTAHIPGMNHVPAQAWVQRPNGTKSWFITSDKVLTKLLKPIKPLLLTHRGGRHIDWLESL
ncbi:hypothetical protein [Arthrobacter sp. Y-9]|uniref:hypothetical protein n=1 Tax=Arthrobacter sp. Y-9 TaxID=3039385 RepID=UPI00241C43C9|nr:hypothetical protein [Arthrobacter sp. Y-9]WFR84658.1 hypothetical protein P9849_03185 [Arthrobacter sp. Y-9]